MEQASETLFALKPVTFHYKKEIDPARALSFGLIAEDMAEVSPELITRDKEGKPETVRYDAVNAMLLNEFLKEHRAFVEQQAKVAEQQQEIEALKKELREQRTLIQTVSDKIELNRSAAKVVTRTP
jgi:septal ring factor EnvC (AmiA/AmiB activator)